MSERQRNGREGSKSQNTTQNASKVKENIQESFKKEPTEIIIVNNETEEHIDREELYSNNNNEDENDVNNKIVINECNIDNNNINNTKEKNKGNTSSKILNKYTLKLSKNNSDKIKNFDKNKKDYSIKIFKINDSPKKKKENKNNKENKDKDKYEEKLVRSNSYRVSYFTDRNFLEDSKSGQNI